MNGGAAGQPGGPVSAGEDRALDALTLAWGDMYDEIWVYDGEWAAHRKDSGDGDVITRDSADGLNQAIRAREGTP